MNPEPQVIRHVEVRGKVQGVGFRAFVEHHARQRGLTGWVRNRRDGSVEALFAGSEKSVQGMIKACRVGPLGSNVDALDERGANEDDLKVRAPADLFSVLATA
ncbi:MAG: acylphosphatase [Pseudolabrys sp.]